MVVSSAPNSQPTRVLSARHLTPGYRQNWAGHSDKTLDMLLPCAGFSAELGSEVASEALDGPHRPPAGRGSPCQPLAGKVVGIDPGHNGANHTDSSFLTKQIINDRTNEDCDTTGTQTDSRTPDIGPPG